MDREGGIDDDASQSTCETFTSDEGDDDGWDEIHNDADVDALLANIFVKRLKVEPPEVEPLGQKRWVELGQDIGRTKSLKKMAVITDEINEGEHEIASTKNLEEFCRGVSHNRSLRCLNFEEFDFGRARLAILHPIVVENHKLCEFRLHQCNLDVVNVEMLAAAFRWRREPASIKTIGLTGRTIGDDTVPMIVELCNCCVQLTKLDLSYSNIGNRGCRVLAPWVEDNNTLRCLYLEDNKFDDEGALAFANAAVNNRLLERLSLDNSDRDTRVTGWKQFQSVVGDSSSINGTYRSNHVLNRLWGQVQNCFPYELGLPEDFLFLLRANEDKNKATAARKKIVHFHLRGDFDVGTFLSMEVEVLPTVLGWIGKGRGDEDVGQSSFSAIYRILRNIPELCGYSLSDRKIRLQLEAENAALQRQNEHLRREIEELRSNKRPRKN